MRDFLLDTQTVRYWYDTACPQNSAVASNIAQLRHASSSSEAKPRILISVITLGEIEFGHRVQVSPNSAHNQQRMTFVHHKLPDVLEISRDAVEVYGELRARLFNQYAPGALRKPKMRPEQLVDPATSHSLQIQENDLWLCAQAACHQMVLVTNDRMTAIRGVATGMSPSLLVQNWTVPGAAHIP